MRPLSDSLLCCLLGRLSAQAVVSCVRESGMSIGPFRQTSVPQYRYHLTQVSRPHEVSSIDLHNVNSIIG